MKCIVTRTKRIIEFRFEPKKSILIYLGFTSFHQGYLLAGKEFNSAIWLIIGETDDEKVNNGKKLLQNLESQINSIQNVNTYYKDKMIPKLKSLMENLKNEFPNVKDVNHKVLTQMLDILNKYQDKPLQAVFNLYSYAAAVKNENNKKPSKLSGHAKELVEILDDHTKDYEKSSAARGN